MSWTPPGMAVKDFPSGDSSVAPSHVSMSNVSGNDQGRLFGSGVLIDGSGQSRAPQGPINAHEEKPWGWRFHPTAAELIKNLGEKKLGRGPRMLTSESESLREIDLSRVEPWDIKHCPEPCAIRKRHRDDNSQYFYAMKEQKYRHGRRNNRATKEGFWKATGRDKDIYEPKGGRGQQRQIIGHRKALVFYKGRAPQGRKTDYILHEYRVKETSVSSGNEEQWVVCHMFVKDRNEASKPPQEQMPWGDEFASGDITLQAEQPYSGDIVTPLHNQMPNVAESSQYDSGLPGLVEEGYRTAPRNLYENPLPQSQQFARVVSFRTLPSFNRIGIEESEIMQALLMDLQTYQEQQQPLPDQHPSWP